MDIYVYQVSDTEYGAGCIKEACEARGKIVEKWPIDTEEQIQYATSYGSAYGNVSPKVTALGHLAMEIFTAGAQDFKGVLVNQEDLKYMLDQKQQMLNDKANKHAELLEEYKDRTIKAVTERLQCEHIDVMSQMGQERDQLLIDTEREIKEKLASRKADILEEFKARSFFARIGLALRIIFKRI